MLRPTKPSKDLGKKQQQEHMEYFLSSLPFINLAVAYYLWNKNEVNCAVNLLSYGRQCIHQVVQTLLQENRRRCNDLKTIN